MRKAWISKQSKPKRGPRPARTDACNGRLRCQSVSRQAPDATVVGRNRQCDLLKGRDCLEIESTAMEFLDVVTGDREPERDRLLRCGGVYGYETVVADVIAGEQQQA